MHRLATIHKVTDRQRETQTCSISATEVRSANEQMDTFHCHIGHHELLILICRKFNASLAVLQNERIG